MGISKRIKWLCTKCYTTLWANYALGLTSRSAEVCDHCGEVGICVIIDSIRLRERTKETKDGV
jgi:hypothetical protein